MTLLGNRNNYCGIATTEYHYPLLFLNCAVVFQEEQSTVLFGKACGAFY